MPERAADSGAQEDKEIGFHGLFLLVLALPITP
jgi:hypothetical protein